MLIKERKYINFSEFIEDMQKAEDLGLRFEATNRLEDKNIWGAPALYYGLKIYSDSKG